MKPVPILQYLDHFGRVGQAEAPPFAQAPAPTPTLFKPRVLRAVPDPAARVSIPLSRALRELAPPREDNAPAPRPRPRAAPSEAEIEARIAAAYERGCRDGAVAARAEEAENIEREVAGERERATLAQLDFQINEYAQFAETVSAGLQAIEQRVAEVVARLVEPLVTRATADRIVEALCDNLARLRVGGAPGLDQDSRPGARSRGAARTHRLSRRRGRVRRRSWRRSVDRDRRNDNSQPASALGRPHRLAHPVIAPLWKTPRIPRSSSSGAAAAMRRSITAAPGKSPSPTL